MLAAWRETRAHKTPSSATARRRLAYLQSSTRCRRCLPAPSRLLTRVLTTRACSAASVLEAPRVARRSAGHAGAHAARTSHLTQRAATPLTCSLVRAAQQDAPTPTRRRIVCVTSGYEPALYTAPAKRCSCFLAHCPCTTPLLSSACSHAVGRLCRWRGDVCASWTTLALAREAQHLSSATPCVRACTSAGGASPAQTDVHTLQVFFAAGVLRRLLAPRLVAAAVRGVCVSTSARLPRHGRAS
jgi:hypothetical protein